MQRAPGPLGTACNSHNESRLGASSCLSQLLACNAGRGHSGSHRSWRSEAGQLQARGGLNLDASRRTARLQAQEPLTTSTYMEGWKARGRPRGTRGQGPWFCGGRQSTSATRLGRVGFVHCTVAWRPRLSASTQMPVAGARNAPRARATGSTLFGTRLQTTMSTPLRPSQRGTGAVLRTSSPPRKTAAPRAAKASEYRAMAGSHSRTVRLSSVGVGGSSCRAMGVPARPPGGRKAVVRSPAPRPFALPTGTHA